MRRAGCGCFLILLSIALLFVFIVIPVIPGLGAEADTAINSYLEPVLCSDNQTIVRELYSFRDTDGTSYSMNVYCQTAAGEQQDVTGEWTIYGIITFLVPFLLGLFLILFGIFARARRAFQDPLAGLPISGLSGASTIGALSSSSPISGTPVVTGGLSSSGRQPQVTVSSWSSSGGTAPVEGIEMRGSNIIRVGGMEIDLNALSQGQVNTFVEKAKNSPENTSDLVTRLKELQDARDAGLITSAEYDKMRQEILNNWTE